MPLGGSQVQERQVLRVSGTLCAPAADSLAVEEPLEIRLAQAGGDARSISITMRTPGHDAELAAGFLFTEGVIASRGDVVGIVPCGPSGNVVRVDLAPGAALDLERFRRNFYTTSSCGVCGKSSLEALRSARPFPGPRAGLSVSASVITGLPSTLRASQAAFEATGGLHASGLFDSDGRLLSVREDVGRHNALDKLIGEAFLAGTLPLERGILLVSGRASFELLQKAAMAGIPMVAAVGAPSSLAVELAEEAGITLMGFVRDGRFNVYSGEGRISS